MGSTGKSDFAHAVFAIEVDGIRPSEHVYFVDAIQAALLVRQKQPNSKIKVRDLTPIDSAEQNPDMAA